MTSEPTPNAPYGAPAPMSPSDEKLWSTLIHLGGLLAWFAGIIPAIVPSLVGYLVLKDRGPFIRSHTAAAFNFQLSMVIYTIASVIVSVPLMIVLIGFVTIWALPIIITVLTVIFSVIAAVKANQGQFYTYPLAIRFVS